MTTQPIQRYRYEYDENDRVFLAPVSDGPITIYEHHPAVVASLEARLERAEAVCRTVWVLVHGMDYESGAVIEVFASEEAALAKLAGQFALEYAPNWKTAPLPDHLVKIGLRQYWTAEPYTIELYENKVQGLAGGAGENKA